VTRTRRGGEGLDLSDPPPDDVASSEECSVESALVFPLSRSR
jgi:hypothetical protein